MKNGAQFNNTSNNLTIKHNNIFINSNLSTNKLTVKDKFNVLNETTFHNNINIISNNSISSSFIIFNNQIIYKIIKIHYKLNIIRFILILIILLLIHYKLKII